MFPEFSFYLDCITRLIYVVTDEEDRFLTQLRDGLRRDNRVANARVYNAAFGLIPLLDLIEDWTKKEHKIDKDTLNIQDALTAIYKDEASPQRKYYVITDPDRWLQDQHVQRRILNILHQVHNDSGTAKILICVGSRRYIPEKLARYTEVVHDTGFTADEILKLVCEKADEMKADISSMKKASVGAEYLPPALRDAMRARGICVTQSYGTADIGLFAYESTLEDGTVTPGMMLEEKLILELVRPGTGDPVGPGEVGEVVVTTFNKDYPLIRFGTGDLSAVLAGASPCGRTNVRIKGWMGRADQTTKVRAMFVTPKQVNEIVRRHPEVAKARLVVEGETGNDRMTLKCEASERPGGLAEALVASIRDVTKLRGEVELVAPGSLPNDGKVIEDLRKYS